MRIRLSRFEFERSYGSERKYPFGGPKLVIPVDPVVIVLREIRDELRKMQKKQSTPKRKEDK